MNDTVGNLALKRPRPGRVKTSKRQVYPRHETIQTKRVPLDATPTPGMTNLLRARAIRQALSRQRLKLLAGIVLMVLTVTAVFGAVVYRQAMILEMNFQNLEMERSIRNIDQENSQISENLAQKTNLDEIRQLAVGKLGLQDPAHSQIVTVRIPQTDRVVFAAPVAAGADETAYLASVFSAIEGYFRTLGQQRQGD